MPPSEEAQQIASAFLNYAKTGDKSLIEKYKLKEIEIALIQYSADKRFPHYSAMDRRISELKEIEKEEKNNKEKRKDRIITFILGVILGLVLAYLKGCLGF